MTTTTGPDLLLDPFNQRWENYRAQVAACRAEFSEPAVHDLRVAARRLLAILEIVQGVAPQRRIRKLRRELKSHLDGFDNLRDTQVMLISVTGNLESLPAFAPFLRRLQKREARLLQAAKKQVLAIELESFDRRMLKAGTALAELQIENLPAILLKAVDRAYGIMLKRFGWIEPDQPATIHRVRVAFKKFRYMVECSYPALPGFPDEQFKRMQAYQTLMGDIQDAEILLEAVNKFTRKHHDLDAEPVRHFCEERLNQVISAFVDHKADIFVFWRKTPQEKFPWTKNQKEMEPA